MNDKPEKVIEVAESQIGSPYVFGAWGAFCTPQERKKRYRYNPNHPTILSKCQVLRDSSPKPSCDGCKWQGDRCFDCRGFTDWTLNQVGIDLYGEGATTQYSTKSNWIERGQIENMPECVCCVFVSDGNKKSHTGLYIGGGETIECSGEVKKLPLAKKWTHYAIPAGLYTADEVEEIRKKYPRPKRVLRKGDRGEDVKGLQQALNKLGFDCGGVDGIFGSKTVAAVKASQQEYGLIPDGVVGVNTWAVIDRFIDIETPTYTVKISGLSKAQADELLAQFPSGTFVF